MPKVVVKSRYLTNKAHMAEYLKYIATREGVELLPEAVKNRAATATQQQFIEQHLKEVENLPEYAYYLAHPTIDNASGVITAYSESGYGQQQEYEKLSRGNSDPPSNKNLNNPATKNQKEWIDKHSQGMQDLLEYEDYIQNPTFGNASELISAIAEYNTTDPEIYLKYIAERPGVFKHKGEAHGLWNMTGKANLKDEIENIKNFGGVAWTHIVSLRREDAHRLSFESADAWRKIVASNADRIAKLYNIDIKNLKLLGAFHNEGRHPHVHLFVYSSVGGKEGIIPKQQMQQSGARMRSMFTGSIFKQDMEPLISRRNELRNQMSKRVEEASKVFKKEYEPDPIILESLIELSKELPEKGKLQYAYLPEAVKGKTNDALRKIIGNDGVLNSLAAEYFALQHTLIEQYIDNPEKIDERYIDFVKRFYEPESGKYVSKRDITTLHNIILRNAAALKDNSKLLLHVDAGQNINLKASGQEIIITETLPTEQKKEFQNKQPEVPQSTSNGKIPIQKLLSNIDIAVDKVEKPEALPVTPEPFRLYDAADNLVSEQQPDLNGHAIFSGLSEGTYTVENSSSVNRVSQPNNYFVRYAAVAAVRLIAEELVALCDTVETSTTPRTNEKSRQRGRFNKHGKSDRKREDIQR